MKRRIYAYAKENKMTVEQIKEFYEIEKQLAARLRNSKKEERHQQQLYTSLYDEMFKKVSCHPQLTRKVDSGICTAIVEQSMQFLNRFLKPDSIFLEIGSGDCNLSLEIAKHVKKVYAVDVSNEITKGLIYPQNFELVISNGTSIPVKDNSISIVYSNQLIEHLHPDDAIDQLQNIYKALMPGGLYICTTPNRLTGPHDVSQCFDEVATGFHLKEYLATELYQLFRQSGFSQVYLYKKYKRIVIKIFMGKITVFLLKAGEQIISLLPFSWRKPVAKTLIVYRELTIVGIK